MEMPEFKPVVLLTNDGGMPCGNYPINELVEYHHTRIVEALKAENEQLRKERDELAVALEDILHSAFEHGSKNLSGKTLDPDGEMLWKAKQLIKKIRGAKDEIR